MDFDLNGNETGKHLWVSTQRVLVTKEGKKE